ncbi:MAG: class I SAM-dependent methyltransferase [Promethearchaeota archaeon]
MKNNESIKEYAKVQYKNHQNLNNRMNLWSYGSNPVTLQEWIFNKIQLKEDENVLELGCGTGELWLENYRNIPSSCSITLSDFSEKMLTRAKANLKSLDLPIKFEIINAEEIPYPNQIFDVVIACHMLYHVPNLEKTLLSISRVLKPNSRFITTTVSQKHIQELTDFLSKFGLSSGFREEKSQFFGEFRNETGREILKPFFRDIELFEYINPVNITFISPLMNYIDSMFPKEYYPNYRSIRSQIEDAISKIIEKKSKFTITGITGLFKSKKINSL